MPAAAPTSPARPGLDSALTTAGTKKVETVPPRAGSLIAPIATEPPCKAGAAVAQRWAQMQGRPRLSRIGCFQTFETSRVKRLPPVMPPTPGKDAPPKSVQAGCALSSLRTT